MSRRLASNPVPRNEAVNGSLDVWQRGTSFTAVGYCADQWSVSSLGTGGAATVSRQSFTPGQIEVPGEPDYYLSWSQTTSATTAPVLAHHIEGVDTFSQGPAVWSFYARASATASCTLRITQSFGTGGSPSADVTADEPLILAPGWRRYSVSRTLPDISGKTLGSNSDHQILTALRMPTDALFTIDIAMLAAERGIVPGPVVRPSISQLILDCQRYFWKSFPLNTAPATVAGAAGAISVIASANGNFRLNVRLPVIMRATPTVTFYNPAAANSSARNFLDSTDTVVISNAGTSPLSLEIGPSSINATDGSDLMRVHVTASAALP